MVGQPIQQRRRQPFGSQHFGPFGKWQVAGYQCGSAFVALAEEEKTRNGILSTLRNRRLRGSAKITIFRRFRGLTWILRMYGAPKWLGFKVLPEHGILVANGASLFRVKGGK